MPDRYEFSDQSPRQKGVLISLKLLVAGFTLLPLHHLGWNSESFDEKIVSVRGVLTGFWIYAVYFA